MGIGDGGASPSPTVTNRGLGLGLGPESDGDGGAWTPDSGQIGGRGRGSVPVPGQTGDRPGPGTVKKTSNPLGYPQHSSHVTPGLSLRLVPDFSKV